MPILAAATPEPEHLKTEGSLRAGSGSCPARPIPGTRPQPRLGRRGRPGLVEQRGHRPGPAAAPRHRRWGWSSWSRRGCGWPATAPTRRGESGVRGGCCPWRAAQQTRGAAMIEPRLSVVVGAAATAHRERSAHLLEELRGCGYTQHWDHVRAAARDRAEVFRRRPGRRVNDPRDAQPASLTPRWWVDDVDGCCPPTRRLPWAVPPPVGASPGLTSDWARLRWYR